MCRISYIPKDFKDQKLLEELFADLDKSMGGDGLGLGWFKKGIPNIFKGEKLTAVGLSQNVCELNSDHGILFHCRRASIGGVNDDNCHPYLWQDTITIHNGHVEGTGVLKLMMLENLDKYEADGWTIDKIASTTDSDILAYFISKRGFGVVPMMNPGTVMTMYPHTVAVYVGYDLQAIKKDGVWIYASEFSDKMGMASEEWVVFAKESNFIIKPNSDCTFLSGYCVNGKELYKERMKRQKKNKKNKYIDFIDVV